MSYMSELDIEANSDYGPSFYPFSEGDVYYTIEGGKVVWSCWDDISEEMYDENPHLKYYATKADAERAIIKP